MLFNVEKETDHYRVVNRRTSSLVVLLAITFLTTGASAFVQPSNVVRSYGNGMDGSIPSSRRHMFVDQLSMVDMSTVVSPEYASTIAVSSGLLLAETEPWVQPLAFVLGPFLNFISFAMLCRVVASWYPNTNLNEIPWSIIAWPTEPLLKVVRGSIPPAFGVDITPVFWVAVFTFINEILLGQQGLLTMKIKYGI